MAGAESRAALFLMESETLALELQGILRSGGIDWTVMLTRAVDAARAALLAGRVDLAVIVHDPLEAIDELLAGLQTAGTHTILVSERGDAPADSGGPDWLVRLPVPIDADRLRSALLPFVSRPAPVVPPRASCA